MGFRRGRFEDVVERQLGFFAEDRAGLIGDVEAALRAYTGASRDEAEERYGDFLDLVDTGQDELVEIREAYAATLDVETADAYRTVFNELARKRFPRFALELE